MAWGRSRSGRRPRGDGTRGPRTSSRLPRASSCFHNPIDACLVTTVQAAWVLGVVWLWVARVALQLAAVAVLHLVLSAFQLMYVAAYGALVLVLRSVIWFIRRGPTRLPHIILLVILHGLFPAGVMGAPVPPGTAASSPDLPSFSAPRFAPYAFLGFVAMVGTVLMISLNLAPAQPNCSCCPASFITPRPSRPQWRSPKGLAREESRLSRARAARAARACSARLPHTGDESHDYDMPALCSDCSSDSDDDCSPRVTQPKSHGAAPASILWPFMLGGDGEGAAEQEPESEVLRVWLNALDAAKRSVEELPVTFGEVYFETKDTGRANSNKVIVTVSCCWEAGRYGFKRVVVSCNETDKPTLVEATLALRQKILEEHCGADHVHDSRAVERLQEQSAPPPANALDRIKLGLAAQERARAQTVVEEKAVTAAQVAEQKAAAARAAAEARLKEAREKADALAPPKTSHKRQRTAFSARDSPKTARLSPC